MSQYCYRTGTRTDTSVLTTFIRSTSFSTSIFTAAPTGTQVTGRLSTTRIPSVASFPTEITRRSTYYTTTCTTYRTSGGSYTYPYYGYSRARLPSGLIAIIVLAGLWYAVFFAVCIYLLCFSKTAKHGRRPKGQGGFGQNQYQTTLPQQQYTPVPQDPLSQYPPPNMPSYGGQQPGLSPGPQNSFNPYQSYNTPNVGVQAPNQWPPQNPGSPSAASFASGPGPGYIPPGAANPMMGSSAGTVSYSMGSTTPSPPPGPHGPGSDPHRLLYTQQNDRLSAAVSLVHPYQQSQEQQQQPSLSSYPTSGPPFAQPQQTPSQTQLSAQYRGYAEPSTLNYAPGRV